MTDTIHPIRSGSDVHYVLEQLKNTTGTNAKQELVSNYIDNPLFLAVCNWTLNSFITYGVKKWPEPLWTGAFELSIADNGEFLPNQVQRLLVGLSERTLTGNAAQEEITQTMEILTPDSAKVLKRILDRSLDCKVTSTIINKLKPGFIPTFDVMRAYEYEEKRVTNFPVYVEEKFDGVRLLCFVDSQKSTVKFFSRSGIQFNNLVHLYEPMLKLADLATIEATNTGEDHCGNWVFDGEALAGAFNKTVGDIRRQKEQAVDAVFHIFDVLPQFVWDANAVGSADYYTRSYMLFNIMSDQKLPGLELVESSPANSHEEITEAYQAIRDRGGEGVIVKLRKGPYQRKKSRNWLKIKAKETVDIVITGKYEGEGKYVGMLGGFLCDYNGVEVRVGGGFTDAERASLWGQDNRGRMIEVEFHEETPDGSLRHARFKGFRDDKYVPTE